MCVDYSGDGRVVFTLDAGGTNYVFAAMVGGRKVGRCVRLDPEPSDLQKSISNIKGGFNMLLKETGLRPCAISFAFPGPADYENGVIYNIVSRVNIYSHLILPPFLRIISFNGSFFVLEEIDAPVFS